MPAAGRMLRSIGVPGMTLRANRLRLADQAAPSSWEEPGLLYSLDRFVSFYTYVSLRGWAYHGEARLAGVCIRQREQCYGEAVLNLPSPDVTLDVNLRFELTTLVPGLDWSHAVN